MVRGWGGEGVGGWGMSRGWGTSTKQRELPRVKAKIGGAGALKTHLVARSEILTSSLWPSTT